LSKSGTGYDHRGALFGTPPYGGTIQQQVYYAASTLCDLNTIDPKSGYPKRDDMSTWKSPFILMVDRGECSFVQKVRNAQRSGATAVLIADDMCICSHGACQDDLSSGSGENFCEEEEPVMADDGSGSDISIPSFLLFKEDADPIKSVLYKNENVRVQMGFSVPAPDSRVEYDLWTSPADSITRELQEDFLTAVSALSDHAFFTPHMYIYDGVNAGCHSEEGEDLCLDLCSNHGRYCSIDIDENSGATGAEVVAESLRRICIWQEYGKDNGIGLQWWDYVKEFTERCDSGAWEDEGMVFSDEECIATAMEAAGVKKSDIDECMEKSGGVTGDNANALLDKELSDQETTGVVLTPSLYVNQATIRGFLNFQTTFKAICAGFAHGSEPPICQECGSCPDERGCVERGKCSSGSSLGTIMGANGNATISTNWFLASLAGAIVLFSVIGYVHFRRQEAYMRNQIRGVVAEYMPVGAQNSTASTSLALDDEENEGQMHTFPTPDSELS